jgi:methylamine dehydrogenase heavy chain
MTKRIGLSLAACLCALMCCAGFARAQLAPDQMKSLTLPLASPDWVFTMDLQWPVGLISKVWIIDGRTRKMLGQLSGGYLSNLEISPDRRHIYMIDTYYSRGWRGTRTDAVSIFDARTLEYQGEVVIPSKRILVVPKRYDSGLTADGRFLLVANMTPATSVSVVDLKARKFVGEIQSAGCTEVLVSGNRRFSSICGDGSFMTVTLDDSGKAKSKTQGKPLFNPDKDPAFDQPAMARAKAYFVTYHGMVLPVDLSGAEPVAEPEWPLLGPGDKGWLPGGWQAVAYQRKTGLLYVLMHKGGAWTHKEPGSEVWVFDTKTNKRVRRFKLREPGYCIRVTDDADPLLFVMPPALPEANLDTYSATNGKFLGAYKHIGSSILLYGP